MEIHHRDIERTEIAQRLEWHSSLCAPSVRSVSLWWIAVHQTLNWEVI